MDVHFHHVYSAHAGRTYQSHKARRGNKWNWYTHTQRKENPKEQWNYELTLWKKSQVTIEGDMIFHTERTKNVTKAIRTNK